MVLAALVPMAFLAVRASPWLMATNLIAIAILVAAAIAFSRSGTPFDTTFGRVVQRVAGAIPNGWTAPRTLAPLVPRISSDRSARLVRIGVAVMLCVPVLAIVSALLASADPVFAGLLTPDISAGPALGHIVLLACFGLAAVCVIGMAASDTEDRSPAGRFGTVETMTMLVLTASVLGLFVIAQLIAATSAGQRLVERSGLTPAEYARSGFFQLCWATGIIVTLLAGIRALATPEVLRAPAIRVLGALVPILALGLVAVSLRRMALYDDAFGLTMLRLWVSGAAVWMGITLILVAARNAGLGMERGWVLAASTAAALLLVVSANVANPEAFVARHNLARSTSGAELDSAYLAQLSDDATPAVVEAYLDGGASIRAALEPALRCDEEAHGLTRLNLGVVRGDDARSAPCEALAGG